MAKIKSTLLNMVIVLGLITAVTSLLLAYVYTITKEPIEQAQIQKLNIAISEVVPGLESFKEYRVPIIVDDGSTKDSLTFYDVYNIDDEKIGTAVMTYDNDGFNGSITVMVGFDNEGNIISNLPLSHSETPGLGDKMERNKSSFAKQFDGKDPSEINITVKKDGGDIDAITAATISSRAYCRAMKLAYDSYENNQTNEKGGNDESME